MKKTLIAMTVAVSAVVSGSVMAASWQASGTGGTFEMSGTLTPESVTPWEVYVGDAVTGLDAPIVAGQSTIDITTSKAIPILGIRTQTTTAFAGMSGIAPSIDFGGAVDVDNFANSSAPLTLDVKDNTGAKIGTLTTDVFAQGRASQTGYGVFFVVAPKSGYGFYGGLPKLIGSVSTTDRAAELMPDVAANFNDQGLNDSGVDSTSFGSSSCTHSGYYFAAIEPNKNITITLDSPAAGTEVQWNASLPVTVTYV
ncbi:TPA: hypothetical protein JZG77_004156 [Escherichia coli]|nr:hypothetical protein [Escherichia coli]